MLTGDKPLFDTDRTVLILFMVTARIQSGAITLSAYNYTLKYIRGLCFCCRYSLKKMKEERPSIAINILLTELSCVPVT